MKAQIIKKIAWGMGMLLILMGVVQGQDSIDDLDGVWNELLIPGDLPYSRKGHTAIYDSQNERMIVFGGWSSVVYNSLNDVWSYNITANTWSQMSTTGGPPPNRAGHVAIYDNTHHQMVVYAGSNWWITWYNDTWVLDLATNTWTQLSTTGAPPMNRVFHAGVYDSIQDRLLIFGGTCGDAFNNWKSNETWALNLSTLTWEQLNTTNNPSPRDEMSLIFDTAHNRMIVFGGRDNSTDFSDVHALDLSNDTWSYLGDYANTVSCHRAVFNPQGNCMIAVAGWGLYNQGQAAVFSTADDNWLSVSITSDIPSLRQDPSLIWDPVGQRALMFGGDPGPLTVDYNDTWELEFTETGVANSETPQPVNAMLCQNYPNPFNPSTVLSFELRVPSLVKLEVFDINGRNVGARHRLAPVGGRPDGSPLQWYPAGTHQITFDGSDLPSGIYFAKLTAGEYCQVQKLILLK